MGSRYEQDLVLWSEEQAQALSAAAEAGRNAPIDWEHIAEEIADLGLSERRALASHVATVIEHLLKLQLSPAEQPVRGWRDTIRRARRDIARLLTTSPSLRRDLDTVVAAETPAVRELVYASLADHDEQPLMDPNGISYSADQVTGAWIPERPCPRGV